MFGKYFRSSNEVINVYYYISRVTLTNLHVFSECHAHYSKLAEEKAYTHVWLLTEWELKWDALPFQRAADEINSVRIPHALSAITSNEFATSKSNV